MESWRAHMPRMSVSILNWSREFCAWPSWAMGLEYLRGYTHASMLFGRGSSQFKTVEELIEHWAERRLSLSWDDVPKVKKEKSYSPGRHENSRIPEHIVSSKMLEISNHVYVILTGTPEVGSWSNMFSSFRSTLKTNVTAYSFSANSMTHTPWTLGSATHYLQSAFNPQKQP